MVERFKEKVALVTGASRGIGKAVAIALAREGATVIVNYCGSREQAQHTVREIERHGGSALPHQCDVSDEAQVEKMVTRTLTQAGRLDVLVNNAGVASRSPIFECTAEKWRRTFDINLLGTFLCAKYAARAMLSGDGGSIVNVSSTNATVCFNPKVLDYDASKAGMLVLTRDLAKELGPRVRTNCVLPGWVETDMTSGLDPEFRALEEDKIYAGRFAQPEEIAEPILFLASDDAAYINGSHLTVDGGYG